MPITILPRRGVTSSIAIHHSFRQPPLSLLLLESHHNSRPMLGAGSSSGLNSSMPSWLQGCGRMGQTSRCFAVCSSPHSHVVCPSWLNSHFCIRYLHRPVPVRRRFTLDQVGHASVDPRHAGVDLSRKQWVKLNRLLCGTARVGDTLKLWSEQACVPAVTLYSRWSLTACYTRLLMALLVFAAHMQQLGFGCKT